MPRLIRLPLLPLAALLELVLLALSWGLALASPPLAGRLVALAKRLPDLAWYTGRHARPLSLSPPPSASSKNWFWQIAAFPPPWRWHRVCREKVSSLA